MSDEEPARKKRARDVEQEGEQEAEEEQFDVEFRSYVPKDVHLLKLRRPQPEVPDMVKEIATRVVALTQRKEQEDIVSLAPKKAAWDLARDLEPKLARLNRIMERRIVELLKSQASAVQ